MNKLADEENERKQADVNNQNTKRLDMLIVSLMFIIGMED
jgi:hypothetical protein